MTTSLRRCPACGRPEIVPGVVLYPIEQVSDG